MSAKQTTRRNAMLPDVFGRKLPSLLLPALQMMLVAGTMVFLLSFRASQVRPSVLADSQKDAPAAPMSIVGTCWIGEPRSMASDAWRGATSIRIGEVNPGGQQTIRIAWSGSHHVAKLEFLHDRLSFADEVVDVPSPDGRGTDTVCRVLDSSNRAYPSEEVVHQKSTDGGRIAYVSAPLGPAEN